MSGVMWGIENVFLIIQTDLSNLTNNLLKEYQTKIETWALEESTGMLGRSPYRFKQVNIKCINDDNGNKQILDVYRCK